MGQSSANISGSGRYAQLPEKVLKVERDTWPTALGRAGAGPYRSLRAAPGTGGREVGSVASAAILAPQGFSVAGVTKPPLPPNQLMAY